MNNYNPVVLVMDESVEDFNTIESYFTASSSKAMFHHSTSLYEAYEIIANNNIDLVLLNLTLEDSTGFKTLNKFFERCSNLPVIVITDTNNEVVGNQAIKAGAQDFLVKHHLNAKLLSKSIRFCLHRHKSQQKFKELSQKLAINQTRFIEAQEMAHFGNWEMDMVSNEMIWTDEVFRIFGCQLQSFKPSLSEYLNYVHNDDKEMVSNFFEQAGQTSEQIKLDHRIVTEGKNIKYIAIQSKVYVEEFSGKIKIVGALQDITERKNNEFLTTEKILSKGMLKVKEQMLTDMSFHIRTPLNSIVNIMHLLENSAMSEKQSTMVGNLKNSIDELFGMVNNLLNYSIVGLEKITEKQAEFGLTEFTKSIQQMVQLKSAVLGAKVKVNVSTNLPEKILTYPKKVTQLFYNLVNIALTDMDASSKRKMNIQMSILNPDQEFQINLEGTSPSYLTDEIISMIKNDDSKTLLEKIESEGNLEILSLAIMNKLVKLLDGELTFSGAENEFLSMSLPVETVRQMTNNTHIKPYTPVRILLVEDHFLNQISTKNVLTSWSDKVTVDIAENGLIAVEKFKEHGYDLILMDIHMPVMNGFESATKIRETSQVPIIALTANSSSHEQQKCEDIGINDYMTKPLKPEDLQAKIMNLMGIISSSTN